MQYEGWSSVDDRVKFDEMVQDFDTHWYCEGLPSGCGQVSVTGGDELQQTWFPFSRLYLHEASGVTPKEMATEELLVFLNEYGYWGVPLSEEKQQHV